MGTKPISPSMLKAPMLFNVFFAWAKKKAAPEGASGALTPDYFSRAANQSA